ncbi:MAG TPA: DUF547 domain-containing protein [Planctomycetota bacterium]|nr:DUF547 domain-containing protein [Planctomycetota bacterium]
MRRRSWPLLALWLLAAPGWGGEGESFDHAVWDRLLKANVSEAGWVDYAAFRGRDAADLQRYLDALAAADPSRLGDRNAERAFWINAYNAVCIRTLLDEGLPDEVPHARFFGKNVFKIERYAVAGKVRSLDEIEHEILRKKLADPRLHAAVVCGASSCPRLRPEAFVGARLEAQLDEECRSWLQREVTKKSERKNYLDEAAKVLHVSKIFSWYASDFGGEAGVLAFFKKFADDRTRKFIEANRVKIDYLSYDWSSNRK